MKHMRIALLGIVAALAALMAAGSASATVCVGTSSCTSVLGTPSSINGELATTTGAPDAAVLRANTIIGTQTVTCTTLTENTNEGSGLVGTLSTNGTNSATGQITGPSGTNTMFKNCVDQNNNPCSVTAGNLPWNVTVATPSVSMAATADGDFNVALPSSAVSVACNFGTCVFGGATVTGTIYNANNPNRLDQMTTDEGIVGQVHFAGVNLPVTSGFCSSGTWSANYGVRTGSTIGSGSSVFVQA